jgi:hypothetical protein
MPRCREVARGEQLAGFQRLGRQMTGVCRSLRLRSTWERCEAR